MSEPIISPWIIYFIESLDNIGMFIQILAIPVFIYAGFNLIVCLALAEGGETEEEEEWIKETIFKRTKRLVISLIVGVLICFVGFSVPDTKLGYKMLVANYVTYENVDALGEGAKDTVDYIFDKIEEVQNGTTGREGE